MTGEKRMRGEGMRGSRDNGGKGKRRRGGRQRHGREEWGRLTTGTRGRGKRETRAMRADRDELSDGGNGEGWGDTERRRRHRALRVGGGSRHRREWKRGGGDWRNWDTRGDGGVGGQRRSRLRGYAAKIENQLHQTQPNMGLSDSQARTQSKTLIYSLCCAVAQTHYFLLILSNVVPIGRIIIIVHFSVEWFFLMLDSSLHLRHDSYLHYSLFPTFLLLFVSFVLDMTVVYIVESGPPPKRFRPLYINPPFLYRNTRNQTTQFPSHRLSLF